jgi:endonuclease YncB( thermonuclease family)
MGRVAIWVGLLLLGAALAGILAMAVSDRGQLGADRLGSDNLSLTTNIAREPVESSPTGAGGSSQTPPQPGMLAREPARAPLSVLAAPQPLAPPPKPDELPKRWRLVHGAVASAAGVLDADGITLILPGIDIVSSDETCPRLVEGSWPCGMAARTAFRAYLRGRALNCRVPDVPVENALLAECLLQGEDPARWLVQRGWARAKQDGPFVAEGETARSSGHGIFGPPVN